MPPGSLAGGVVGVRKITAKESQPDPVSHVVAQAALAAKSCSQSDGTGPVEPRFFRHLHRDESSTQRPKLGARRLNERGGEPSPTRASIHRDEVDAARAKRTSGGAEHDQADECGVFADDKCSILLALGSERSIEQCEHRRSIGRVAEHGVGKRSSGCRVERRERADRNWRAHREPWNTGTQSRK